VLPVLLLGVDRPALAALLAERGLTVRSTGSVCAAALISEGRERPVCPAVVEAATASGAGELLDEGADDVVLTTDPDSLVAARIAALVRRTQPCMVQVGEIAIDTAERRATLRGDPLALLPREYALLLYLARHVGVVVDHASLHRAIWGRGFHPGTNVIAVHVSRLRAKLADSGVTVITDRGRGYQLTVAGAGAEG
jgi:two-component system OmpR family response regulator